MSRVITFGRRSAAPDAPYDIADECEQWARQSGRTGTLHFVPTLMHGDRIVSGTWMLRLSLRPNDKRMQLYQQGMAPEPPTENVWFHRSPTADEISKGAKPDALIPLDIQQMGASGVREFLERGDTWSGRGQYASIQDEMRKKDAANEAAQERQVESLRDRARQRAKDMRRQILKIPFIRGGLVK